MSSNHYAVRETFSRLAKLVPGFGSYAKKESARKNDFLVRSRITNHLKGLRDQIEPIKRRLARAGLLERASSLTGITDKLVLLESICSSAKRGYSPVFQDQEITESVLIEILNRDEQLLLSLEAELRIGNLLMEEAADEAFAKNITDFFDQLDTFELLFRERDQHIDGVV